MSKVDTTFDKLLELVAQDQPKLLEPLIDELLKQVKPKRKKVIMEDKNLNRIFKIKRINHTILAEITAGDENFYNAKIVKIVSGDTKNQVGDTLTLSKRELQLTGVPTASNN